MEDNPYGLLWDTIRKDSDERNEQSWVTGIIRSLSPLAVEVMGETVTGGIFCNPLLLERRGRAEMSGLRGSLNIPLYGGAVLGGNLAGDITIGVALAVGDRVVALKSKDGQELAIICKVVSA